MADDPPTRDVKEFQFQQMCKFQVGSRQADDVPKARAQLLAVSNKYGLTFVGVQEGVKVIKTVDLINADANESDKNKVVSDPPLWTEVTTESPPSHLALSNDDMTLAVCVHKDNTPHALLYDIRMFAEKGSKPSYFKNVVLSGNPNARLVDFVWNPGSDFPAVFATVMSDGGMTLMEVKEVQKLTIMGSLKPVTGATAVCWSPKGKQIVVGKKDGTMQQFDQELKLKKNIGAPTIFQDNPVRVLDIQWLTTFTFQVAYIPQGDDTTEQPSLVFVQAPKTGNVVFTNYEDVCFGQGEDRQPAYYLNYITKWGLMTVASANATECGILGKKEGSQECWELWTLEDSGRAQLPTTENYDDTFPVGVAVDLTSQRQIPIGEEKFHPPAPVYMLLNTDGQLLLFHMMNYFSGIEQLTCAPQVLTSAGARVALAGAVTAQKQPPVASPAPASATPAKTSLFGQPGAGFSFGAAPSPSSGGFDLAKPLGQSNITPASTSASTTSALGGTKFAFGSSAPPGGLFGSNTAPPGGLFGSTTGLPSSGSGFTLGGFGAASQPVSKPAVPAITSIHSTAATTAAPLTSLFSMKGAPPSYANSQAVKPSQGLGMFGGGHRQPQTNEQTDASSVGFGMSQQVSSSSSGIEGLISQPKPVSTAPLGQQSNTAGQLSGLLSGQPKVLPQAAMATSQPQVRPTMTSQLQQPAPSISKPIAVSHPVQQAVPVSAAGDAQPQGVATVVHPSAETPGVPSGNKLSVNETVESTFSKSIMEEMSHFEKEMQDLKARSSRCQYKVGTKEELSEMRKDTESVELFTKEIKTLTQGSNNEIHSLKSDVLDGFTQLEECRIRQQRSSEPRYQQLLRSRALDPMSAAKMKELRAVSQNIDKTLSDANMKLDEEWETQQNKKSRGRQMQAPSTDTIYRTLSNNHNLILSMTKRIDDLMTDLQAMKLHNLTASWENRSFSISEEKSDLEHQGLSDLADSLLETKLSPKEPPLRSLSPEKQSKLREMLGRRTVTPVKVTAPANLSMSKIVSAQELQRVLSQRFEADTSTEEEPYDSITELKAIAKQKDKEEEKVPEKIPSTTQVAVASMTARKGLFTSPASASTPSRPLTFGTGTVAPPGMSFGGVKLGGSPGLTLGSLTSGTSAKATTTAVTVLAGSKPTDSSVKPKFSSMFNPGASSAIKFTTEATQNKGLSVGKPFAEPQVEDVTPASTSESGSEEEEEVEDLTEADQQTSAGLNLSQTPALSTAVGGAASSTSGFKFGAGGNQTSFSTGGFTFGEAAQSASDKQPAKSESKPGSGLSFGALLPSTASTTSALSAVAGTNTTAFGGTGHVLGSKPTATTVASFNVTPSTTTTTTTSLFGGTGVKLGQESVTSSTGFSQSFSGKPIVSSSSTEEEVPTTTVENVATSSTSGAAITTVTSGLGAGFSFTSAPSGGFTFGSAPSGGGSVFGGTAGTTITSATETKEEAASGGGGGGGGLFGKSAASSGFGFTFCQSTTGSSVFGGSFMTPAVATSAATAPTVSVTAATTTVSVTTTTAAAASTVASENASVATPLTSVTATTGSVFGGTSATTSTTASTTGSLFGGSGLFGQTTSSGTAGFAALGGGGGSAVFGSQSQPEQATSTTSSTTAPALTTTSASVFGGGPQSTSASTAPSVFGGTPSPATRAPLFGGSQPASTAPLFGEAQPNTSTSTATTTLFGGNAATTTATTLSTNNTQSSALSAPSIFGGAQPSNTTATAPLFGSTQPASSSNTSAPFGGVQPTSATTGSTSVFGGASTETSGGMFGSAGGSSVFGVQPSSTGGSVFGSTTFGQSNTSVFGQQQQQTTTASTGGSTGPFGTPSTSENTGGLFGGGGGLFGGLGGKPSEENASKNVFGGSGFGADPSSQSGLFGASTTPGTSPFKAGFGSPGTSVFGGAPTSGGSGTFSSGAGGVAQTGFGGFGQQQQENKAPGGFGASPSFGGAASFGGRPAFGSPPAFGGSAFGGGATFSSPVGGGTFGSAQPAQTGGFAAFANTGSSPTFGALAQGGNTPTFGSAAQSQSAPTFGGFGSPQGQPQQASPNFTGWR